MIKKRTETLSEAHMSQLPIRSMPNLDIYRPPQSPYVAEAFRSREMHVRTNLHQRDM
jgi:hypothetical protein